MFTIEKFSLVGRSLDLFLCLCSLPKSILESTSECLHVTHTSSTRSAATLSLSTPIKTTAFSCWICTRWTSLLLDVEGYLSATTAGCVRLVVPLSKWGCTFCLYLVIFRWLFGIWFLDFIVVTEKGTKWK